MGQHSEAFSIEFAPDNVDPEISLDTQNHERLALVQKVLLARDMDPINEQAFLEYLNMDVSDSIGPEEARFLFPIIESLYHDERILGKGKLALAILELHKLMGKEARETYPELHDQEKDPRMALRNLVAQLRAQAHILKTVRGNDVGPMMHSRFLEALVKGMASDMVEDFEAARNAIEQFLVKSTMIKLEQTEGKKWGADFLKNVGSPGRLISRMLRLKPDGTLPF